MSKNELEVGGWKFMAVCKLCSTQLTYTIHKWPIYCPNCGVDVFLPETSEGKIVYTKNVYVGPARYTERGLMWFWKYFFGCLKVQTRQELIDEIVAKESLNNATRKD